MDPGNESRGEAARLQTELLRAAVAYLDHADGPSSAPFDVRVGRRSRSHSLRGKPADLASCPEGDRPETQLTAFLLAHFLSPIELLICRLIQSESLAPPDVVRRASRCGSELGLTKVKTTLAELVRRGLVTLSGGAYTLADGPLRGLLPQFSEATGEQPERA